MSDMRCNRAIFLGIAVLSICKLWHIMLDI